MDHLQTHFCGQRRRKPIRSATAAGRRREVNRLGSEAATLSEHYRITIASAQARGVLQQPIRAAEEDPQRKRHRPGMEAEVDSDRHRPCRAFLEPIMLVSTPTQCHPISSSRRHNRPLGRAGKLAVSKQTTSAHLARVHLRRRCHHHCSRMIIQEDPSYQCNLPPRFQDRRLRHRQCHQCPSLTIRGSNSPSTLAIFPTQPL